MIVAAPAAHHGRDWISRHPTFPAASVFSAKPGNWLKGAHVAAVRDFDFAPHRFNSVDKPLSRIVVFARSIMEVLAGHRSNRTGCEIGAIRIIGT